MAKTQGKTTTKSKTKTKSKTTTKTKGRLRPIVSRVLGTILLLSVIALAAPLAIPRIMGYEVYDVVSGSMDPEIPIDSVMYVQPCSATTVQEGEVIAFWRDDVVVAHRVVYNRTTFGEFVTKGDANNVEDPDPVPYDALVGRVTTTIPYLGKFMYIYASNTGKVYLLLTAMCGVMLHLLADQQRRVFSKRVLNKVERQ